MNFFILFLVLIQLIQLESFKFRSFQRKLHMHMFKEITKALPDFHRKGDEILNYNKELISIILQSDWDDDFKKDSIKVILDCTIKGDELASSFLKKYRKMIDEIL